MRPASPRPALFIFEPWGEALLDNAASPLADPLPFADLVNQSKANASAPDGSGQATSISAQGQFSAEVSKSISATPSEEGGCAPLNEIGEKLVQRKVKDKDWDTKAVRQGRSIFGLFSRFLIESNGTDDLYRVEQKTSTPSTSFCWGMAVQTRNRHFTNLGQLLKEAKKTGKKWMDPDLDISEFRAKDKRTARQARQKPGSSQVGAIFHLPVFLGCKDWRDPHLTGTELYHGALYYGTMIGVYHGARREEYCGLLTSDIIRYSL